VVRESYLSVGILAGIANEWWWTRDADQEEHSRHTEKQI
jgi:hypothetical protein